MPRKERPLLKECSSEEMEKWVVARGKKIPTVMASVSVSMKPIVIATATAMWFETACSTRKGAAKAALT